MQISSIKGFFINRFRQKQCDHSYLKSLYKKSIHLYIGLKNVMASVTSLKVKVPNVRRGIRVMQTSG